MYKLYISSRPYTLNGEELIINSYTDRKEDDETTSYICNTNLGKMEFLYCKDSVEIK